MISHFHCNHHTSCFAPELLHETFMKNDESDMTQTKWRVDYLLFLLLLFLYLNKPSFCNERCDSRKYFLRPLNELELFTFAPFGKSSYFRHSTLFQSGPNKSAHSPQFVQNQLDLIQVRTKMYESNWSRQSSDIANFLFSNVCEKCLLIISLYFFIIFTYSPSSSSPFCGRLQIFFARFVRQVPALPNYTRFMCT